MEAALSGRTKVERLDLSGRSLSEVYTLAGLGDLEVLDLGDNAVEDLWPLAGLAGLRRLDLSDNGIADVSPLAGLTGLERLDLSGNRITDVSPLAGLTGLERLDLSGNRIADVSALSRLTGLEVLLLDGNTLADVFPLSVLTELVHLGLSINRVSDVDVLAELVSLKRLDLTGALFLLEKYAHHRSLRAVSRMLSAHGLDLAPGTLADSLPRFVPLFAPLVAAIAERQAAAHVAQRRSVAQRGGGAGVVRGPRRRGAGAPGLRPLRRLRQVGVGGAGAVRAGPMLGICCGPDYVAESSEGRSGHEFLGDVRNIIFRFAFFCHGPTSYHKEIRSCSGICSSTAARSPTIVLYASACHLLQAGVDLNTILAWLGHASLDTSNIYAEIELEMKAKGDGALRCRRARTRSPVEGEQGADGLPGAL